MRLLPEDLNETPEKADWSYDGIVAYSKVCTHVGCPVALYEQQTHHLLCPCHQSQFDVTERRGGHLRPGRPSPAAASDHGRRRGLPRRPQRLHRTRRPELLGAPLSTSTAHRDADALPTPTPQRDKPLGGRFVGATANYIDERTSLSGFVKELGRKIFPDHWSFMLGEIALWSFVVVLLSGTFLTFFFQASMVPTHYTGAFLPMRGVEMSAALDSSLTISFDLRGGLLVRQIHHWAALVFVAGIGVHMLRIFFTGAFRKPRELNWVIGFILFILAMGEGFTGYSLPDDLLSGNGLRIIDGMVKGIPLIGTWTSFLLFGGEFPGTAIVGRLYTLHILLLPAILVGLLVRAPHADGDQQAHAVRRPRPHEQQRRRLPDDAGLHVEDGRVPLHHVRRDRAHRLAVHDQPDLELRTVRPVPRLGGHAARLVHRLRRRRAATGPAAAGSSSSSDRTWSFNILVPLVGLGLFIVARR